MNKQQPDSWVTLTVADNEALAEMTKGRLEQAKIPVVLVPGDASAYMGASSPYELKVPAAKLAKAQELIEGKG